MLMERQEERAGAAANVARNCKAMGAEVVLVSACGEDQYGRELVELIEREGIRFCACETLTTTQKLRIIGRSQQMCRVDIDPIVGRGALEAIDRAFMAHVDEADVVVFSDYGKGALAGIAGLISVAKSRGKTVLVDPKGYDYEQYRGADLVKPNLNEMKDLVGGWKTEYELEEKARKLRADAGIGSVLLTRASDGMTLYSRDGTWSIPADAREVYDVSGAGDTAIAALAVGIGRGYTLEIAAKYANRASGIVVGRFGTAVATEEEVFW
jgi:rfaE bifunctional protein kinase chain/domain